MDRARVAAETEKLRSALLTSISHDLRTPLASILGSATSLQTVSRPAGRGRPGRAAGHHPGGSRAPQSFHRQSAGHDAAGIRRAGAAIWSRSIWAMWWAACCGARRRCWPAAPGRAGSGAGPADAAAGPGAVRAGAVQSAGQCRQICAGRHRHHLAGAARRRRGAAAGAGRGRGLPEEDRERMFDKFYRVRAGDQQARRHRAWGLPSPAASWKRWAAPSPPPTAAIASGAVFTLTLPVPAMTPAAHPDRG